jgi:hypothetical protein
MVVIGHLGDAIALHVQWWTIQKLGRNMPSMGVEPKSLALMTHLLDYKEDIQSFAIACIKRGVHNCYG